jgi:hypothetical protein
MRLSGLIKRLRDILPLPNASHWISRFALLLETACKTWVSQKPEESPCAETWGGDTKNVVQTSGELYTKIRHAQPSLKMHPKYTLPPELRPVSSSASDKRQQESCPGADIVSRTERHRFLRRYCIDAAGRPVSDEPPDGTRIDRAAATRWGPYVTNKNRAA